MTAARHLAPLLCWGLIACAAIGQTKPQAHRPGGDMRMPWKRGDERFLRSWLVAGPFRAALDSTCMTGRAGDAGVHPAEGEESHGRDGSSVRWHAQKSWGDDVAFDDLAGPRDSSVALAFTTVHRDSPGSALLSTGSLNGIRVWVNGTPVLSRDGLRSCTPDEDQVPVTLAAGENSVLIKTPADGRFYARILEPGTVTRRRPEIGPSLISVAPDGFTLKTDASGERAGADAVTVEVVRPGGTVVYTSAGSRGSLIAVDARAWPAGPYEVRCTTHTPGGLLWATHLPWYRGDFTAKALELAREAAAADASKPEGFTLRMLASMVEDRLGCPPAEAKGNPWLKVHSPLMEYDELMLERRGQTGRIRPYGFVRIAYTDDADGSVQFCRAYLPAHYDPARKWPLVIQMHGFNPANPVYVRWWSADQRHGPADGEFPGHEEVIYMEPHGRGNTWYLGMGDRDIMEVIAQAKRLFNVDEDRIYLTGDSMGGWGTWNIASRHPDVFAAIAPVFGGSDYRVQLTTEEIAGLAPVDRLLQERASTWAMAENLLNVPVFVHHGDADQAVNVEYSRWGVRLMQRWGYDVRYHEYPGSSHEALGAQNGTMNVEWFLARRRNPSPLHVRIRSAELRHASAYWVHALQAASPLAFMEADAEVVDRNVIRLDSDNILEFELSPGPAIVDTTKPVTVVWNGAPYTMKPAQGRLRLTAAGYRPAAGDKCAQLPGTLADVTSTPFAVIIGTIAPDSAMNAICRFRAAAFVEAWRDWQKCSPRVFADTALSDGDLAQYSLILFGGPNANRVAARLAGQLPFRISGTQIAVGGHAYTAPDAALQAICPHPLNSARYVVIAAATSPAGMFLNEMNPGRLPEWDYVILDGRVPASGQRATSAQMHIVSGMFDARWRYDGSLACAGDPALRARGRLRRMPDEHMALDAKLLGAYAGRYQVDKGPAIVITREGNGLSANISGGPGGGMRLIPDSPTSFWIGESGIWITFVRNSSGRVTALDGWRDGAFTGTRVR